VNIDMASFRTVPRYFLLPPLHADFGIHSVSVVDLSLKGARVEIAKPLAHGARFPLIIETKHGAIQLPATVLWCEIDELSLSNGGADRYLSGVVFDESSKEIGELIETLLKVNLALPIEDARSADRYSISSRLTGAFDSFAPVSVLDLSIRGARIALPHFTRVGATGALRFQVDGETGPVEVQGTVMWCIGADKDGFEAGIKIDGCEEQLRIAIHRLCMRDEARIDLHSLRRRFDAMRSLSHQYSSLVAS
jgi:hypothetical protein